MAASTAKVLILLIWSAVLAAAETAKCSGNEAVCAARAGAAMLQIGKKGDNLEGHVATLAAEIESLTNRVSILQTTVGLTGVAELVEKGKKPYEKYTALLHSKYDDAALKEVVTDLEAKATTLKGNIKALENEVSGTQFDAALLAMESKKVGLVDDSLTSRVTALEELVSSLRSRVKALEAKVSLGLPQAKSSTKEHALLLQNDKSAVATSSQTALKAKGAPLKGRLATVETEIASLQQRVATLETEVMGSSDIAAAMLDDGMFENGASKKSSLSLLDKKAANKGGDDKADDLKSRAAAAEASAAALRSKIAMLQNHVVGGAQASLLQVDGDGSSLKGRIVSLEEAVDSMRTDVSSLEHTVMG